MTQSANIKVIDVDKIGSAASPLELAKTVAFISSASSPRAGDVVVVGVRGDVPHPVPHRATPPV